MALFNFPFPKIAEKRSGQKLHWVYFSGEEEQTQEKHNSGQVTNADRGQFFFLIRSLTMLTMQDTLLPALKSITTQLCTAKHDFPPKISNGKILHWK